jgi:hypothetical protein
MQMTIGEVESLDERTADRSVLRKVLMGGILSLIGPDPVARTSFLRSVLAQSRQQDETQGSLLRLSDYSSEEQCARAIAAQLTTDGFGPRDPAAAGTEDFLYLHHLIAELVDMHAGVTILLCDGFEKCRVSVGKRLLALLADLHGRLRPKLGVMVSGSISLYGMSTSANSPFVCAERVLLPPVSLWSVARRLTRLLRRAGLVVTSEAVRYAVEATGGDTALLAPLIRTLRERAGHGQMVDQAYLQEVVEGLWQSGELQQTRGIEVERFLRGRPVLMQDVERLALTGRVRRTVDGIDASWPMLVPGLEELGLDFVVRGVLNQRIIEDAASRLRSEASMRPFERPTSGDRLVAYIPGTVLRNRGGMFLVRINGSGEKVLMHAELFVAAGIVTEGMGFALRTVQRGNRIITELEARADDLPEDDVDEDTDALLARMEEIEAKARERSDVTE